MWNRFGFILSEYGIGIVDVRGKGDVFWYLGRW